MGSISKVFLFLLLTCRPPAQSENELILHQHETGVKIIVVNKQLPLLKILLPGQSPSERGIEVEFPEHVTGLNKQTNSVDHIYLVTRDNNRTLPAWKIAGDILSYETEFNNSIKMVAKVQLERDGVRYSYTLTNHSDISYDKLQAVTCVKLYSLFSDTLLERTYVHHPNGFELLASETPERLTMPLTQWFPCRYLVSYTWPVASRRVERDEDSITRYNKSRKADKPFIATFSHDKKWVAATYTRETGNLWTNPERSCQHADPSVMLRPGESETLQLKTFIIKGGLDQVLQLTENESAKKD